MGRGFRIRQMTLRQICEYCKIYNVLCTPLKLAYEIGCWLQVTTYKIEEK